MGYMVWWSIWARLNRKGEKTVKAKQNKFPCRQTNGMHVICLSSSYPVLGFQRLLYIYFHTHKKKKKNVQKQTWDQRHQTFDPFTDKLMHIADKFLHRNGMKSHVSIVDCSTK